MIYAFYGNTKGKTSSALGTITRALGYNKKVRVVFFMKHWQTSETKFIKKLQDANPTDLLPFDIKYHLAGDNNFLYVNETFNQDTFENTKQKLKIGTLKTIEQKNIEHAKNGLKKATEYLKEQPFLLVLDEILYAVEFGLLKEREVFHFLLQAKPSKTHIIITGKNIPQRFIEICDLVTENKKIKHPFDNGVYSIKGLDY